MREAARVDDPSIAGPADATPAPRPPAGSRPAVPQKTWRAGTLVYPPLGLVALFAWLLLGDFAMALKERSVPPTLQLLLAQHMATNATIGTLLGTLPSLIGMVLTPVVSYRSDRHRGRWGRRIPYLLVPTPLAVVSMAGLAFSPQIGRWAYASCGVGGSVDAAVVRSLGVFWVAFEVSSIICLAVFGGLCNDVVPRELLGRFYGLFGW